MQTVDFKTYFADEAPEFADWPERLVIWARADENGEYTLWMRFKNGLGLISASKYSLQEAIRLVESFKRDLDLSDREIKIDITADVLEQPHVLNRRLKKHLQRRGMYWKGKEVV